MKKNQFKSGLLGISTLLALPLCSQAQWNVTPTTPQNVRTNTDAKLGVGDYPSLNTPIDVLTVGGDLSLYPTSSATDRKINGRSLSSMLQLSANSNITDGSCIQLYGKSHTAGKGMIDFTANAFTGTDGNIAFRFNLNEPNISSGRTLMTIYRNGLTELNSYNFSFVSADGTPKTLNGKSLVSEFNINSNTSFTDGSSIQLYGTNHSSGKGMIDFNAYVASGGSLGDIAFRYNTYQPGPGRKAIMTLYRNGSLEVCGRVRAKEVVVETGWCDYVFNDNYRLRSLNEVEQYIRLNKHLPEIPTTEEITNGGAPLGEMTSKLLLKVEELTLYMIQMKKENEELKKRIEELAQNDK